MHVAASQGAGPPRWRPRCPWGRHKALTRVCHWRNIDKACWGNVTTNDSDSEPGQLRRIALVAHDGRKLDMREWAEFNRDLLACHQLYATGTTGRMLSEELGLPVTRFQSGPL